MAYVIGQRLLAAILNDFDPSGHVHAGSDLSVAATSVLTGAVSGPSASNIVNRPYFHGWQSVVQTITNLTPLAMTFTNEEVDNINGHSTSVNPSRYLPNIAGRFLCLGQTIYAGNVTGDRTAAFRKNGATLDSAPYTGAAGLNGAAFLPGFSGIAVATISCNGTTDYIELWANQNSGGNLNTFAAAGATNSWMICTWMTP